jgi:putative toxin-antitoxin system antitoxin component (TIGR02293 family)
MNAAVEAMDLLGAGRLFKTQERSSREFWRQIEQGLPAQSFDLLIERIPSRDRLQWKKMVSRQGSLTRLSQEDSEKAGRLAYILALAKEVWGDWKHASSFLTSSHQALDGKTPLDAARSEWGAREVEAVLRKIQFGLPA